MKPDELLALVGLVVLAVGAGLVASIIAPVVGLGVVLSVGGAGILIYALFLAPDKPEVS